MTHDPREALEAERAELIAKNQAATSRGAAVESNASVEAEFPAWTEEDKAYELGRRDGYELAVQDLDLATGGDGEFKGSTIPGETVDVPAMKARIIDRFAANASAKARRARPPRPSGRFRSNYDGFTGEVVGEYETKQGEKGLVLQQDDQVICVPCSDCAKMASKIVDRVSGLVQDEAAIRADEREKCAMELQSRADGFNERAATAHTREVRASSLAKASALIDAAAAIRSRSDGGDQG